jgi:ADP-ribose pyrophosphatase
LEDGVPDYFKRHASELEIAVARGIEATLRAEPQNPVAYLARAINAQGIPDASFDGPSQQQSSALAPLTVPPLLEGHEKALGQDNQSYPQRQAVPTERVPWALPFPDYEPVTWTHEDVLANNRELSTGNKWADPPDVARAGLEQRVSYAGDGHPKPLVLDARGTPQNPIGRTGLRGRGLLGKWGPNHAADPIVTRDHPDTGKLQVVAIQRKDTKQWAIPGGMVDDGEAVSATLRREFKEEAGNIKDSEIRAKFDAQVSGRHTRFHPARMLHPTFAAQVASLFESGKEVYRGYVDDPRNTDNAWTETIAFHFHCSAELGAQLPLSAGDDAGDVMWLDVDIEDERYRDLYGSHRDLVDRVASGMQDSWTASGWLAALGVADPVANALLGGAQPFDELHAFRALASATTSEAALAERLRSGGVVEALAKAVLPALQKLVTAPAATGEELDAQHGKFAQEGKAFTMTYGDLSTFFGGLEKKIGPPNPKVREAMEREHTGEVDSHDDFTTGNYGVTTTPEVEWLFVVDPKRDGMTWPLEEKLRNAEPDRMRKPMIFEKLEEKREGVNQQLRSMGEPEMLQEECIGARLYTGPMCDTAEC